MCVSNKSPAAKSGSQITHGNILRLRVRLGLVQQGGQHKELCYSIIIRTTFRTFAQAICYNLLYGLTF